MAVSASSSSATSSPSSSRWRASQLPLPLRPQRPNQPRWHNRPRSHSQRTERGRRRPKRLPEVEAVAHPWVEPGLPAALEKLSERQRQAILLCHGYGWTLTEAAEVLGVGASTVQRHIDRGMEKLRTRLGVTDV